MSTHEQIANRLPVDVENAANPREWLSTAFAFALLLVVDVSLKSLGFRVLRGMVRRIGSGKRNRKTRASVSRICSAVDRAAVFYFKRAWCLQRSITATLLLRLRGFPVELVIGAQKMPFYAHAWVEWDGKVVNDKAEVQKMYRVLDRW